MSPFGVDAGATGGIGGNQPYAAASMAVKRELVDVRALSCQHGRPVPANRRTDAGTERSRSR